jgi:CRISPR-associated endonuclease/helicase Cas3
MKCSGYWGKTNQGEFHRLLYHVLDVTACAIRLIERSDRLSGVLSRHLPLSRPELTNLLAWAALLHDLGKLSPAFQHQSPQTSRIADQLGVGKIDHAYDVRHDSLGWELWQELSARANFHPLEIDAMDALMRCATGHHGKPPSSVSNGTRIRFSRYFTATDIEAGQELLQWGLTRFRPVFPGASALENVSWWIAGVITLADWLGSSIEWFPYCKEELVADEYLSGALLKADRAIDESGVVMPTAARTFGDLFAGYTPTPVQQAVLGLPLEHRPFFLAIEETTGGGKTEAALAAAAGSSFYFGLPSMATANGLWRRVKALQGQQALLHGKSWLMPDAMDRATAWLNDSGRKALLADIGIGTVDQAMIGAMYAKYGTLRLAGLAGKTLIIDEVHAYDIYMKRILQVLIEMQGKSGGSVILLSATLPLSHRRDYASAWCQGAGIPVPDFAMTGFPLISFVDSDGGVVERDDLKSRYQEQGDSGRRLSIEHVSTTSEVIDRIRAETATGKCVAWIRNTVGEATDAYDVLKALGADVMLFHSRFVAGDRVDIENRVIEAFGKESTAGARKGKILVATQVIEQSLDLDFDFMVTDLCPVDLLIQRAGRLHRHASRGDRGCPVLLVHAPAWTDDPSPDWMRSWSRGAAFVYGDHGALWNTLRLIGSGFTLPGDSRKLVEGVYAAPDAPAGLLVQTNAYAGRQLAQSAQGGMSAINPKLPYQAEGVPMWNDIVAPTRLGEPVSEWLVFESGVPITGKAQTSTIQLRNSQILDAPATGLAAGKWQRPLSLVEGKADCVGPRGAITVTYDQERGLALRDK